MSYCVWILLFSTLFSKFVFGSNYYENTNVQVLNGDEFLAKVKSNSVSLVEFHTDSCTSCKDFSKVYKDLATVFKDLVPVLAVNDEKLTHKYRVKSFPSVKLFLGKGPNSDPEVVDFTGDNYLDPLVTFTLKNLNKHVKDKASKLDHKSKEAPKKVVQLTVSNFKSTVVDDTYSQWLVKFYAPWCGHCQNLEPEWMKLPKLGKGVKVGRVDCTVHESLCAEYNIRGYPTILLFNKGEKSPKTAKNYQGPRSAQNILEFAQSNDKKLTQPTHAKNSSVLKDNCSGPLCLLFFLPSDSKSEHLKTAEALFSKSSLPFGFTYTMVGEHKQWEKVFGLSEFPTVVGLNMAKGVYLPLNSSFTKENLDSFVNSILTGRAKGHKLDQDLVDETKSEL